MLKAVFNLAVKAWELKALRDARVLEKPTNPPRVPSSDINRVLDLLVSWLQLITSRQV